MIFPDANIQARIMNCSSLPDNNAACFDSLAAK
jgi:hypothetical protein